MEILIAVGAAVLAGAVAWAARGRARSLQPAHDGNVEAVPARRERGDGHHQEGGKQARQTAPGTSAPARPAGDTAEELVRLRERLEQELAERRAEIARLEERILQREESLERRLGEVDQRERSLNDREVTLDRKSEALDQAGEEQLRMLERVAGMSRAEAKRALVHELEATARHDVARTVRQLEEEARRDSARKARSILAAAMQRLAAGHAAETTVSVVQLPSDDMKG